METHTVKKEHCEVESNMPAPKYKVMDMDSVMNGKCSVGNSNIAINGVVARVVVDRFNFDDFFANKTKQSEDTKTRGKKRKLQETKLEESLSEDLNKGSLEPRKKRGRPKKIVRIITDESETSESDTESVRPKQVKKRGRPKKSITSEKIAKTVEKVKHVPESKQLSRLNVSLSVENRRFNGGNSSSDVSLVSSPRVRKPNSRLQDFVVSSTLRYYPQSPVNKPIKEMATTPKEKAVKKVNQGIMEDPLKIPNNSDDVLNKNKTLNTTRNGNDVVRSFLPVFDDSLQSDESDDMEEPPRKPKKMFKEKENQVNNLQVKFSKNNPPKPKSFKSDQSDYSPPKLRSGNDIKLKISTPKPTQKNLTKNITLTNQKKPAQSPAVDNKPQQKRQNLNDEENSVVVKPNAVAAKVTCDTSKAEAKMNGSNSVVKQHKTNTKYVLVESDGARNKNKSAKVGDVDFNKLVRSLKLVKLPAANWKIRIVVSKQQTITEVTFTNKEVNERCIKFSRIIAGYAITFGKSVVNLLGAPTRISSFNDVSILLDIVHHISPNDPVLEYSTTSNV